MAHILIIDDNYDMLSLLEMILHRQAKHQVTLCQGGHEGLEKAFKELPDIAIVDVMMPDLSGYDVVKQLREDPRTQHMGIIILTARGQPIDKQTAIAVGADSYMTKPVHMKELTDEVNRLLKGGIKKAGSVIPLFSLRGGVGTTTLAVNMASLFSQIGSTILLDLSPNSGHCALFAGIRPKTHWGHYLEGTETDLEKLLLTHSSGLKIMAAPPVPMQSGWFMDEQLNRFMEDLRGYARFVIVDTPPLLGQATDNIFKIAQHIIIISGNDPAAIQTTLATLKALSKELDRVLLIHNTAQPMAQPPTEALQRILKARLTANIPYDKLQVAALRKGVPLAVAQPDSPMITGLKAVIKTILS
ncbi:MAG: response regulator [Anaerolineae bacterium]|nr:response regulator [Anaerolineae bacterium]